MNPEHFQKVNRKVDAWNNWRVENPNIKINLNGADLHKFNLCEFDFRNVDLTDADLSNADLRGANLAGTILAGSYMANACLAGLDLTRTLFDFRTCFRNADLSYSNLSHTNLTSVDLFEANLFQANLSSAILESANMCGTMLASAVLHKANLKNVLLIGSNLAGADLTHADLTGAELDSAHLVHTNLSGATLINCSIYGTSVWGVELDNAKQLDLVITLPDEPTITINEIEVASFIHLLLNNEKVQSIIDTVTSKVVLILGRFSEPERKAILYLIRERLHELGFLPILFDFEKPTDKDITETIMTLAGMSLFIIADVTSPKSSPLELQATVPDFQIPFIPIIHREDPFSMIGDLQSKYDWVLDAFKYENEDELMACFEVAVVNRALAKHAELRIEKAKKTKVLTVDDFRPLKS